MQRCLQKQRSLQNVTVVPSSSSTRCYEVERVRLNDTGGFKWSNQKKNPNTLTKNLYSDD